VEDAGAVSAIPRIRRDTAVRPPTKPLRAATKQSDNNTNGASICQESGGFCLWVSYKLLPKSFLNCLTRRFGPVAGRGEPAHEKSGGRSARPTNFNPPTSSRFLYSQVRPIEGEFCLGQGENAAGEGEAQQLDVARMSLPWSSRTLEIVPRSMPRIPEMMNSAVASAPAGYSFCGTCGRKPIASR